MIVGIITRVTRNCRMPWRCNFATFSWSSSSKNLNIHTVSDNTVDGSLQLSDGSHHA